VGPHKLLVPLTVAAGAGFGPADSVSACEVWLTDQSDTGKDNG